MITKEDNKLIQIKKRGKRKKNYSYNILWGDGDRKETESLRATKE